MVLVGDHPRKAGVKIDDGRVLGTESAQALGEAGEPLVLAPALCRCPLWTIGGFTCPYALAVHLDHLPAYLLGDAPALGGGREAASRRSSRLSMVP